MKKIGPVILGIASFLIPFGVYLHTLLPAVGGYGDTAKFQFVGRILGLTHPSGFPVYIWLTHFFSYLPVGDLAYRMNLFSAVCAGLTIFLLWRIMRQIGISPTLSLAGALLFAVTPTFWSVSLIAEVYTLNALFLALVIFLLWKWRESEGGAYLGLACVAYGLSLGNHLVSTILFPAAVYWILFNRRKLARENRYSLRVVLFLAAALIPYLWLYLRFGQAVPYREEGVQSLGDFFRYVLGISFSSCRFPMTGRELVRNAAPIYFSFVRSQFGWVAIVIGIIGLVRFWRRDRQKAFFTVIVFICDLIISLNATSIELPIYYLPSYLIFSIWIAAAFLPGVSRRGREVPSLGAGALILYALILWHNNLPLVDLSGKTFYGSFSSSVLKVVPGGSVILSPNYNWTEVYLYKILGEGVRDKDEVVVLHYWDRGKIADYLAGRFVDPRFYGISKALPGDVHVYLHLLSLHDPLLSRLSTMGFAAKPVMGKRSALAEALKKLPPGRILLVSLRDEGIALLNDDSYDALQALGLKTVVSRGHYSGWGYAGVLVSRDGKFAGIQRHQFKPVEISLKMGDMIGNTGIKSPVDILVESRGIGKGDKSMILVGGKEVAAGKHGLNFVIVDAQSGRLIQVGNIPPARLDSLRESFLFEITSNQL